MSSIEEKRRKLLVEFYEQHILPLAAHPATARLEPARDDDNDDSFYVVRTKSRLEESDFEVPLSDADAIIDTLERMWGGTPLVDLPKELMKLAKHFEDTEARAEVSAFVYEMF